MPKATSLGDLLRIRAANAALIDRINDNLGCALGFKTVKNKMTAEPAVIIFVPSKAPDSLVPKTQEIPKQLDGPDGLFCKTDVVVGKKATDEPQAPAITAANEAIVSDLRSGNIGIVGGVQLGGYQPGLGGYYGTAACVVKKRMDGKIGLLTNQHVGGPSGRPIYHPEPSRYRIGFTQASYEYDPDEYYFNGLIDEEDAYYRIDCAFVELSDAARALAKSGLHKIGVIGAPLPLDLNTMGPIGTKVVSIGRTRGIQKGTIIAFAYEFEDSDNSIYTDYLIIGEAGSIFSDHGDSGKLIVTDDAAHNAVALLWGGWFERLRKGHGQENWTYAIDINKALNKLEVDIATGPIVAPTGPTQAARARVKKMLRPH